LKRFTPRLLAVVGVGEAEVVTHSAVGVVAVASLPPFLPAPMSYPIARLSLSVLVVPVVQKLMMESPGHNQRFLSSQPQAAMVAVPGGATMAPQVAHLEQNPSFMKKHQGVLVGTELMGIKDSELTLASIKQSRPLVVAVAAVLMSVVVVPEGHQQTGATEALGLIPLPRLGMLGPRPVAVVVADSATSVPVGAEMMEQPAVPALAAWLSCMRGNPI
jgi:hypothetical protein